ncbi:trifunctional transcriptional regulator/proline dehydrogenase/L-glutamate gamma-semialdehyde dehydrogenase [Variovorax sp. J22P168]|uniref:trifunctional transcriptional regulator/proline dehydrogenase/L-glutamate gamma-semialdehyde dehydrogenase n=1 Tax=Variovorax jilinensis TaxID=3053513 RepID=UPI002577673F|nr:trifunctional transcriptional regulator/proline dehydrogenase/L-glutamate gamma-semialdehyde dehydrogenase [Variovorax sp. J22P168]MDM0014966.1 trifunctional transcriptional regulator/proline dehydrogenase/L-glutamate gamma-semialdehyde dehydrogenase [Variovorax sp. J22P168]
MSSEYSATAASSPSIPFADGLGGMPSDLRASITAAWRRPEPEAVPPLLQGARLPPGMAAAAQALAHRLATRLRERKGAGGRAGLVQGLLQEYALSSQEGVALMCLAEALLRIPDTATRDALIRDKIADGHWQAHAGHSPSVFVNAATWGLLLTGKLVATHSEAGLTSTLTRLIGKGGEPLIRKGVDMAMRMMGEQFVTGETIEQALAHARALEGEGFRYSYDMLGEAALTAHDARRYRASYEQAIHAIGRASAGRGVYEGPGISIKLSALHPRYSRAQHARVMDELYPVLRDLTLLARRHDIGLNIDAEEADRLELSLDLLERLCFEPALAGWNGIGFVIQAYQKRCPFVIDHVVDLGRRSGHRLMVRLVKGAYWDSEIKRAQVDGLEGYPVFTRKAYTDVSYLACARQLLAAPDAVYPQFATHNAHTLAAIHEMAGPAQYQPGQYEFQCLHGMGEPLYEQVVGDIRKGGLGRPCRIYAPVGTHETLLAYLVRRLLENGANTSFVNRIADPGIAIDALVEDPVATVERMGASEGAIGLPHPAVPLPGALYGTARRNSSGLDLSNDDRLRALETQLRASAAEAWVACPMLAEGADEGIDAPTEPVRNPADLGDVVGQVRQATLAEVDAAIAAAQRFAPTWAAETPAARADRLERAADLLQGAMPRLLGLLSREAGKTHANGIAEVREAVDFLRFYAAQARTDFTVESHRPLGPVVCISPWNFPLAIFVGQLAAALAAGNPVLAKPAEQTPLIAAEAVRLLWQAGVPRAALQLLPGRGETTGAALVGDARVQGVMFTGSTEVARILQGTLAARLGSGGRPVPLIAETGGQNAMIVDSSALVEQVVADVMASAFDSAGQRCSALRLLCVQEEVADRLLEMLKGAMAESRIGNPATLAVDVGPVIDAEARDGIERHIADMQRLGRQVYRQAREVDRATASGTFVVPALIELQGISDLKREVFGPVLHVVRFRRRDLGALIGQINGTGYGLTLGVHTRIDETIAQVIDEARAGNVYVNRNIVGAVVGVQPFGGEGLSGTGPKAGGPLYMYRLLASRPDDVMARAHSAADPGDTDPGANRAIALPEPLIALQAWARRSGRDTLARHCANLASLSRSGQARTLAGPTGERNVYALRPREAVLCLAESEADRLLQLAAVLAVGSTAVWVADTKGAELIASLPPEVGQRIASARDWRAATVVFDAVLFHGDAPALIEVDLALARRAGPIVGVRAMVPGETGIPLESLVIERASSVNTAAAGGNASLMTIG